MAARTRKPVLVYGAAAAAVALAWLVRWLLEPLFGDRFPFLVFTLAVFFVAWLGGFRPGLAAVGLSLLASLPWLVPPRPGLVPVLVGAGLFVVVGVASAALSEATRRSQRRLAVEVAQRRRSEAASRRERDRFRVTLSNIGDAVITTDTEGRVRFLNHIAEELTGWRQEDARGLPLADVFRIVNEETREQVDNPVERALREGRVVGLANRTVLLGKDGTEQLIDDSAAPIRDQEGAVTGVVLVFRSIAERRKAAETQSLLAAIVESSEDAVISKDLAGIIRTWNDGAARLYGYAADEVVGRPISVLIPPGQADELPGIMERLKRGERIEHYETTRVRRDGMRIDVSVTISPLRDVYGRVVGASAIARDISGRRRADRRRNARLAVNQILSQATMLAEAAPRILAAVCEALQWDIGALWRIDAAAGGLRCAEFWRQPGAAAPEFEAASRARTFARGEGLPGRVWATARPAWIPDVAADDNFPRGPIAAREGLRGAFGYPIVLGAEVLGVIEFFSHEVREPDTDLFEMMATIGSQIGQFIERCQAEGELRRSEQELADFFENASVGLHWEGSDGTILRANRAELEMLGYASDEYVGRSITDFHVDRAVSADILARLRRGETLRDCEVRLRCKDGSVKDVLIDSSVMWEDGRFVHTRCFTRDVTDRKRLERELHQRIDELAAGDRRKTEFLATLAHELRNPLAPIRTALELIRLAGGNAEALAQARALMERQADQLVRLVDDLLDVSRITSGKISLRRERLDLTAAIDSAVETSRPLIESAGHTLTVTRPAMPVYVDGDLTRLAQVFANLLNNAAKYTEPGGRIALTAARRGDEVTITVEDSGVGIPAEALPMVFEMFTQVDRSLERAQGGLGIGLALVRGLVQMHGGRIEAHSEGPMRGSRFVVHLPVLAEAPAAGAEQRAAHAPPVAKRRILVVDDNRDSADSLATLLELMGNDVRTVYDGEAAVATAAAFEPEVILLDIGLPKLNGLDAARQIRAQPFGRRALMVAMTGWGQDEDRRRSREAGFDAHCTKPIEPDELRRLLAGRAAGMS